MSYKGRTLVEILASHQKYICMEGNVTFKDICVCMLEDYLHMSISNHKFLSIVCIFISKWNAICVIYRKVLTVTLN